MKRLVLSVLALVVSVGVFGQLPVDSTVQNKNVILEEFTGIHCGYCPDGHKISNTIMSSNPGDVFVINIHTGGYAAPSGNEPDFRTSFGSAIAGQSGLAGYPAGTVNRHLFAGMSQGSGTAMSRGDWQAASNQILGETSYANMAMDASIDLQTRELTVDVQLYFTGSGAPSAVNMNIAVLQNNVPGPQSGASANPAQVLPNGDYNHMHMLRHLITGQWGDVIDTTAQGTLIQRTYTYTIPADINGVAMELGDLEVVGFIAEGQQEIITGAEAAMNFVAPVGVDIADLEVKPASAMPGWCDYSLDPKVKVINKGNNPVDTFRVGYDLNATGYTYQTITTTLAPGDSTTVTFPTITLPDGENTLMVNANVDSTHHLLEMVTGNNTGQMPTIYTFPANAFASTIWEDFEAYTEYENNISNTIVVGDADNAFILNKSGVQGLPQSIGAYGQSENSLFFYFYNMPSGSSASIVYEKIDLSNSTNTKVRFDHAYAQYSSENDKLLILASDDCGNSWTTIYEKMGSALATAPANSSGNFFPETNQWASDTVDMSAMDGESEVLLAISGVSDYGNNLYVDNLVVYDDNSSAIAENENVKSLNVYPNPATDFVNVDVELAQLVDVEINVVNMMGQIVSTQNMGTMTSGSHNIKLNTNNLAEGLYTIQIITGNKASTERISIVK
jgi:hypothetical protein